MSSSGSLWADWPLRHDKGHWPPVSLPISVFSSPATLWSILVVTPMATIWQKGQIALLPCRFYDFDIFWWPLMFVVHGHTKGGPNYFLIAGCANESTIDDTTGTWSAPECSLYVDKGCTIHYPLNRVLHFCISSCRLKSGLGMCLLIVKGRLGVLQLWGRKMPPVPLVVSGATSENWGTTSLLTTVIESLSSLYTRVFRCFLMGKVWSLIPIWIAM